MAYTNRQGLIARFKTGYLQREIILPRCKVEEGADESVYDASTKGYIVGRIVTVTKSQAAGSSVNDGSADLFTITTPTDITAANILTTGNYIIAQSDNSMRGNPDDYIPTEKYNSRYDGLVKNTTGTDYKAVAVYRIVNPDDIELLEI